MSKSRSKKKYDELKAYYKEEASKKEKQIHMDLTAVRHEYVPHHLKNKFLTGCAIFGSVYLTEKLIFGKRIPRILRFTTSLASIVLVPKVYQKLHDKLTGIGELDPIEMEMLEDQQLADNEFYDDGELNDDKDWMSETDTIKAEEEFNESISEKKDESLEDDENKSKGGVSPT